MKRDVETILVYLVCVIFAAYGIQAFLIGDIFRLYAVLVPSVILSLIPLGAEKGLDIRFPAGIKSLVALSLLLHVAGGISRFYWEFAPFYDKVAHVVSAAAVVMLVFVLFMILDYYNITVKRQVMYAAIIVISLFFMLAWEAGEFFIDVLVKTSYNNGIIDTIGDIISDGIGLAIGLLLIRHHLNSLHEGERLHILLLGRSRKRMRE